MAIGNLSLDQLRVLVTIADEGSFSAAARKLFRAQSAISQAVATLEEIQGVRLFDRSGHRPKLTDIGQVLVDQARLVLASAARFEAIAFGNRSGLEAELTLAIDPLVPTEPLIKSLNSLHHTYPHLPLCFMTEGLGGALRRLRDGSATLAICLLLPSIPEDVVAYPLLTIDMAPVVAPNHPLATLEGPVTQNDLESYIQLILSDNVDPNGPSYGITSAKLWRFVDIGRRLDFLLAGFGWCRMPNHLVTDAIKSGQLIRIDIENDPTPKEGLTIYAAHLRDRPLGIASRWLLDELKQRLC